MNSKTGFNRLGRRAAHRKSLIRNMMASLLKYERITTTKAKALEVRRYTEKLITRAKVDSVHNRREAAKKIYQPAVVARLFNEIGPRFTNRPGGYTRIVKLGQRPGDAAEMVILELVDKTNKEDNSEVKAKAEKKTDKKADSVKKTAEKKKKEVKA